MPPYDVKNIYNNNTDDYDERTKTMTSPLIQAIVVAATKTTNLSETIPIKKKKNVTFSESVLVKKMPHINDMNKVMDINNIWYNSEEFDEIRFECKTIIDQMNTSQEESGYNGIDIDNNKQQQKQDTIYTRGLENYTTSGRENSQRRKFHVIQAVLDEQDFQRSFGMNEPELLAVASLWNSNESQALAMSFAIQDYKNISI